MLAVAHRACATYDARERDAMVFDRQDHCRSETNLVAAEFVSVSMPIDLRILIYGVGLLYMLAGVSIAVAWHRRIILGEQPRLSGSNIGAGSFWRYAGVGIAILLLAFAPMVLGFLVLGLFLFPFISHATPAALHLGTVAPIALIMLVLYLADRRHAAPVSVASCSRGRGYRRQPHTGMRIARVEIPGGYFAVSWLVPYRQC